MNRATNDGLIVRALERGCVTVDLEAGAVFDSAGQRAEVLDKRTGYGRVKVQAQPLRWAMAHRVVWLAAHGTIHDSLQINHVNRVRWDNRIENLELVSAAGNVRHALDRDYDVADPAWLERLDPGDRPDAFVTTADIYMSAVPRHVRPGRTIYDSRSNGSWPR